MSKLFEKIRKVRYYYANNSKDVCKETNYVNQLLE